MKASGVITVVLLVGLIWVFGWPPAVEAGKKPESGKPPAVEKSTAKVKPFIAQWWRNKKRREFLGLTKDQVQALEAVIKDSAVKRKALNQRLKKAQKDYNRLMSQGEFNSPRLKKISDEMVASRAGLIRNRINAGISIGDILSPAQREKIIKKDPKAFYFERPLLVRKASGSAGKRAKK